MADIIKKHSRKLLWLFILLYITFFSIVSLQKYYAFGYNAFDLAIFNQVFFNTLAGRWFEMTVNIGNFSAYHFSPIIILLLPIYALWQSPVNLLILQSIVIALSAWPLYKIAKSVSQDNLIALSAALIWLLNPFVHNTNLYEFHLLPLAVLFIFWTFYFYHIKAFKRFFLFFILALLVREDIALVLVSFSILSFLDKRSLKWIVSPLLSILYFIAVLKIVSFFDQDGIYKFLIYYSWLGGHDLWSVMIAWFTHPLQFLGHLFSVENIFQIFFIFLTFGFLPLFSPRYLWLSVLPILEFALTNSKITNTVYNTHYALLFLAGFFIALIFSLNKIKKDDAFWASKYLYKEKKIGIYFFILAIAYFSFFMSPVRATLFKKYDRENIKIKQEFVSQIPKDASIMISGGMDTNLSSRHIIYPLQFSYYGRTQFYLNDFNLPPVDYILIDMEDFLYILSGLEDTQVYFNRITAEVSNSYEDISLNFRKKFNNYNLIKVKDNILLWQNKELIGSQYNLPLYDFEPKSKDFNSADFLVYSDYLEQDDTNILKITYQKIRPDGDKFLLRFYKENSYFDIPLDYGLWPIKDWPQDELISFYYYLDRDVGSYQLFSWSGSNQLGDSKDVALHKKLMPETGLIYLDK